MARVALNAHFFHHPGTGSGQYLQHLLRYFQEGTADVEAHPYCDGTPQRPPGGWPGGVDPVLVRTPLDRLGGDVRKVWWEQVLFPRVGAQVGASLLHVPYFAPPLAHRLPLVTTIHDLIPLILPEYVTSPLVRLYNSLASAGARRASLILADSEASKRDIIRLLHVPESRVRVVYLAGDESVARVVSEEEIAAVRAKYGLADPYIFYFGGLDKRKNVPALLRALAALPGDLTWQVAISGRLRTDNPSLFPDLLALAADLGISDRTRFLGFAPDEDKPALLRGATCFAFPSLYEGFGMDPLEALACATPVICSNRSSLPELMGNAAVLIDPDEPGALTEALRRVLTDDALRRDLSERGPAQAALFTWSRTAQETGDAYRWASGPTAGRHGDPA